MQAIIISTAISTKKSNLPAYAYAQVIYWVIATSPITITSGFAIYQIYMQKKKNGYINWVNFISLLFFAWSKKTFEKNLKLINFLNFSNFSEKIKISHIF